MTARSEHTDQCGRRVSIASPPQRIVSLVPSQTEFLYAIGLDAKIVGRTKFCIHPTSKVKLAKIVGGTKTVNIDRIRHLKPDLIIANKEENTKEQIDELAAEFPVWVSDIVHLEDAYGMMMAIGAICDKQVEVDQMVFTIRQGMKKLQGRFVGRVAYIIWQNPLMLAGKGTFIDALLSHLGFENAVNDSRYPQLTHEQLAALAPTFIFLSSEPFPFKKKHIKDFASALPTSKVLLVDGEMFSWYGNRLLSSLAYFENALAEELRST